MQVQRFKKIYNKRFEFMPLVWYNETAPRLLSNRKEFHYEKYN